MIKFLNLKAESTEVGYKVVPRLREFHLLVPSGRGAEITQPRARLNYSLVVLYLLTEN